MRTMAFIRSKLMITEPSIAFAPPDSPVPAPRGTIGTRCSTHHRTTAWVSAAVVGRTTASGVPYGAHSASSWL